MVISLLIKIFLFYVLYLFFRGVFRTYSTIKVFKGQAHQQQQATKTSYSDSGVIEAEYKVINKSEK